MMPLLVIMGSFPETLEKLFWGYIRSGFPFLVLHLIVAGFLIAVLWEIASSIKQLNGWAPNNTSKNKGEMLQLLDQFVSETKALSSKGFYVPISDYSERLDSITDTLIAKMYDRTNLFLIVGIAGTLFGLFEFAYRAYAILNVDAPLQNEGLSSVVGERLLELSKILLESMSKAFPIGFFGLFFTFISQLVIAPWPEKQLRLALAGATRRALEKRKTSSESQAELIQEAANTIKESVAPLKDLKSTLTDTINPVVKTFGEQLNTSLELVKEQFKQLEAATKSVHGTIAVVQNGVQALQQTTDSLKTLLESAPKVLERTAELQERQKLSLIDFEEKWKECLEKIQLTSKGCLETTQKTSEYTLEKVQVTSKECLENIIFISEHSLKNIQLTSKECLEKTQRSSEEFSETIQQSASKLQEATQELSNLPENINKEVKQVFISLAIESYRLWETACTDLTKTISQEYITYIDSIKTNTSNATGAINGATEALKKAGEEAERLTVGMGGMLSSSFQHVLKEVKAEASESLKTIRDEIISYPKITENIKNIIRDTQEVKELQKTLETTTGTVNDTEKALRHSLRVSEQSLQAAKELEKSLQVTVQATTQTLQQIYASIRLWREDIKTEVQKVLDHNPLAAFNTGDFEKIVLVKSEPSRQTSTLRAVTRETSHLETPELENKTTTNL